MGKRQLQSLDYRLPINRGAHHAAMLPVSHQRKLQPDQYQLPVVSLEGLSGHDQSQPRSGGNPADLPRLPQHYVLGECDLQPCDHGIRTHRSTHEPAMFTVSRKWELRSDQWCVLDLSLEEFPGHD